MTILVKTLPKAQRTRGLSSYHKFKHKSWSNFIFRISTKHQLQNFNQTSASRLNLKFTILSRISTKIQLHNLYKTSATKYRPNSSFKFCLNFNFKILTKPCAQSLNKSLALWTILSYQICNKLLPIQSSSSTLATVTISTSFELVSSHARVTSIKFTKQEWVSESGSESVSDKHSQWSDSGLIKMVQFLGKKFQCFW